MNKPDNTSYRWVVLVVAFITLVLGYAIRNCFSVFYPAIVEEFGWQRGNTALIFSISIIVYGLAAPVAGGLVDRFSPRVILPIGAVILGGGMVLCSQADTQWEFYIFYGVMVAVGLSLAWGISLRQNRKLLLNLSSDAGIFAAVHIADAARCTSQGEAGCQIAKEGLGAKGHMR